MFGVNGLNLADSPARATHIKSPSSSGTTPYGSGLRVTGLGFTV